MTMTDFCAELRNYFEQAIYIGTFTIADGAIQGVDLQTGQYFRIVESTFNDGVYKYPVNDLTDETFTGGVLAMAVPPSAIALFNKIKEWDDSYGNTAANYNPYTSESFHHYSRSKSIATNARGEIVPTTWQGYFRNELNRFRRI